MSKAQTFMQWVIDTHPKHFVDDYVMHWGCDHTVVRINEKRREKKLRGWRKKHVRALSREIGQILREHPERWESMVKDK